MNRKRLKETLVRHEGERLKPYKDTVGKLTIGVGRNLDDCGISHDESMYLLNNDIDIHISEVKNIIPNFDKLNDIRQEVLVNMCFNLGAPRMSKFRNMIGALISGDFKRVADEMLNSRWAKQVGKRAIELSNMMSTGEKLGDA